MQKLIASLLVALCAAASAQAADEYNIDSNHTFPVFEVSHLGFSTQRGRFNKTSGKIVVDREAKTGSVEINIEVASLDMGFSNWDQHMAAEGFFNTENFPTMSFKSNKLIFDGERIVGAEGDFTLLGVTKPIRLAVNNFRCGTHPVIKREMCGADIATTIKRSDFGMTKAIPMVSDEVKIYSPVEAFKIFSPAETLKN